MADRIVSSFDPACTIAPFANDSLTSETYKVDFSIPLPMPVTDWTECVESTVSWLKRNDVKRVGTIRPCANDDMGGVRYIGSPDVQVGR
jgi:hypothetical protein